MSHIELNPDFHENHYFESEVSFSEVLHEATSFVEDVEEKGGDVVSFTTAQYLQDSVDPDSNGFLPSIYQVFLTVLR